MSDATATDTATKEPVDHAGNLSEVFVRVAGDFNEALTPEQVAEVQEAFRTIPAAARGKAQATALKAVIEAGNMSAVESLLDVTTNLPKASGTPRSRVQLDPVVAASIQAAAMLVAYADITSDPEVGEQVATQARGWYNDGPPEDHKDAILRAAANAVKASKRGGRGGTGGARRAFKDTLADIVAREGIKTPATLTFGKDGQTAKLLKSGEIKVDDDTYANPSAAAKALSGDGKASINGWTFFQYEGKPIADLRKPA